METFLALYVCNDIPTEHWFNGIKGKEQSKQVYGDEALAAESIEQSIEEMKDLSWDSVLRQIGYLA